MIERIRQMELALAVSFLAGEVQRITHVGFELNATPALVVVHEYAEGVRLGIVASAAALIAALRHVKLRRLWRLISALA